MSSLKIKKTKKSPLQRNAELLQQGYDQCKKDILGNFDPEVGRLNPEATSMLIQLAEVQYVMGQKRTAFVLRMCAEMCGDRALVEEIIAKANAEIDLSNDN